MIATTVRVRPAYGALSLVSLAVLVSLAFGLTSVATVPTMFDTGMGYDSFLAVLGVTVILPTLWIATRSPRRWRVAMACFVCGFVGVAVWAVAMVTSPNPIYLESFGAVGGMMLVLTIGFGLGCSIAGVVAQWLNLVVRHQIVEQDGTRCWACGYPLTGLTDPRCPECGRGSRNMVGLSGAFWTATYRIIPRLHIAACIAVAILTVVAAHRYWTDVAPRRRFIDAFAVPPGISNGCWAPGQTRTWSFPYGWRNSDLGCYLLTARPDRALMLTFDPRQTTRVLRVRLALASPTGPGFPPGLVESTPNIVCDFNAASAEAVMASGIPDIVVEVLMAAAGEASWPPSFDRTVVSGSEPGIIDGSRLVLPR